MFDIVCLKSAMRAISWTSSAALYAAASGGVAVAAPPPARVRVLVGEAMPPLEPSSSADSSAFNNSQTVNLSY
jgi:hypothetical protein